MGKLQRAVTSIQRCESKFFQVKSLVSIHSARSCKNYVPKYSQPPHELDYLFNYLNSFFQGDQNTKQKKNVQKPPYNQAGCIVEPYNASRQPKFQFCQKVGKGRHVYVRASPRPSRSAWAETLQTHGFPVQTYGKLQRAVTSFLRCESKFFQVKSLVSTHSACPCKSYVPRCSQIPHELHYLSFVFFST